MKTKVAFSSMRDALDILEVGQKKEQVPRRKTLQPQATKDVTSFKNESVFAIKQRSFTLVVSGKLSYMALAPSSLVT